MNRDFLYKKKSQLFTLVCACLLFVFIIKPWELYFLNDDFVHIPLGNDFLILRSGFMRPVPNFFLMWDRALYHKHALGYFCTSLALHFICVFLVYVLVRKVDSYFFRNANSSLRPVIAALLFLFYPYHAEPIMWIIGRVAIIAAIFSLAGLYYYLKIPQKTIYILPAWLCFAIALFTYESIWNITLIFFIISIVRAYKYQENKQREICAAMVMGLSFLLYMLLRKYALGTVAGNGYAEINENITNVKLLLLNTIKLTGRNFTPPFVNTAYAIIFFLASLLLYSVYIIKMAGSNRRLAYFAMLLWVFIITGVVTASPLGIDTHYSESERYIYYSSFFFCLFIALIITETKLFLKNQVVVTILVCLLFLIELVQLQRNYKESSAIVKTTVAALKKNSNSQRVLLIDVPNTHYGVPVLRINPMPVAKWMVPEARFDTMLVINQVNNKPAISPYTMQEISWPQLNSATKINTPNIFSLTDSTGKIVVVNPDDLVLWYRKDGLYKVNITNQPPQMKE